MIINRRFFLNCTLVAASSLLTNRYALSAPVDASAPGIVPALKQPSSLTCWATVATMMYSWKNNQSVDIPTALAAIGDTYLSMFRQNKALSGADKPGFLLSASLKAEAPQNYTIDGWANLINQFGPLWVTTNEGTLSSGCGTDQQFAVHARVLTGIFGDGTPDGTSMVVMDPGDGQQHTETVSTFVQKFEDVARIDQCSDTNADLRPQVVHY